MSHNLVATLAPLRSLGILCDEDRTGSFHQRSTFGIFRGRFAFEILQRNGYNRFGALNAPVRTAIARIEFASSSPLARLEHPTSALGGGKRAVLWRLQSVLW